MNETAGRSGIRKCLALAALLTLSLNLHAAEVLPAFSFAPQVITVADRRNVGMLYARTCAACHGDNGEGRSGNGLSLFAAKDQKVSAAAIHFGRAQPPPLTIVMPAYGNLLTPLEIGQLSAYIASFRPDWP